MVKPISEKEKYLILKRELSIDVLRGLAIIGMILSGTISRNPDLPAWLFHAQIGPPDFKFDPSLPGITWVDLVFPFFIFAMGMAFPYALSKIADKGVWQFLKKIVPRSFKLLLFAIMLGHLSPFHYPAELGWVAYFMGFLAFVGFFLAFSKFPHWKRHELKLNVLGYGLLIALCVFRATAFNLPVSIHRNDIIILVLANLALFGALIWFFTRSNWYLRLGIMAIYFTLRLTNSIDDSWNKMLWDFSPFKLIASSFPAVYNWLVSIGIDLNRTIFCNPEFLKYLMILIPGTIAGDLLFRAKPKTVSQDHEKWDSVKVFVPVLLLLTVALNLWGLLSRNIGVVWIGNIAISVTLIWFLKKGTLDRVKPLPQLIYWSIFWLMLGLVFEAYQGGIKKDHSTISYFFMTSGLAGFSIVFFKMSGYVFEANKLLGFIGKTGVNPIVGYVAAVYFVMPLLYFIQILPWMDGWHQDWPWAGVLRGMTITGLMVGVTVFTVNKKYFWKT